MREPIRDKGRLQHILEAIDFVLENTKSVSYDSFSQDKLLYGAVIYYTMIIGEASYKLSKEFKQKYNEVAWKDIEGMRHHLVHGYYQVDARIIWNIINKDIIELKENVEKYLSDIDWEKWEKETNTER